MALPIDRTGRTYGNLIALHDTGKTEKGARIWAARCTVVKDGKECGQVIEHYKWSRKTAPKSCGCLRGRKREEVSSDTPRYTVYALIDPRSDAIRYVGSTRSTYRDSKGYIRKPAKRAAHHLKKARLIPEMPLSQWINSLLAEGLRPIFEVLDTASDRKREKELIKSLASVYDLLNKNWNQLPRGDGYPLSVLWTPDLSQTARNLS